MIICDICDKPFPSMIMQSWTQMDSTLGQQPIDDVCNTCYRVAERELLLHRENCKLQKSIREDEIREKKVFNDE